MRQLITAALAALALASLGWGQHAGEQIPPKESPPEWQIRTQEADPPGAVGPVYGDSGALHALLASSSSTSGPNDDIGTLPKTPPFLPIEYTHYLVTFDDELDGTRVIHPLGGGAQLVYEFVGVSTMRRYQFGSTSSQVGSSMSPAWAMPASQVFAAPFGMEAPWIPTTAQQVASCTSAACHEPHALCSGWCDVYGNWQCLCTGIDAGNSSGTVARLHKVRLENFQEVFPPE